MSGQIPDAAVYTPTITNTTNVDASTAYELGYFRLGNSVYCYGQVDVDPTLAATGTEVQLTLPITSNFSAGGQLAGTGVFNNLSAVSLLADTTTDRARVVFISTGTTSTAILFGFSYRVI